MPPKSKKSTEVVNKKTKGNLKKPRTFYPVHNDCVRQLYNYSSTKLGEMKTSIDLLLSTTIDVQSTTEKLTQRLNQPPTAAERWRHLVPPHVNAAMAVTEMRCTNADDLHEFCAFCINVRIAQARAEGVRNTDERTDSVSSELQHQ